MASAHKNPACLCQVLRRQSRPLLGPSNLVIYLVTWIGLEDLNPQAVVVIAQGFQSCLCAHLDQHSRSGVAWVSSLQAPHQH